jgi:hypothetical protein
VSGASTQSRGSRDPGGEGSATRGPESPARLLRPRSSRGAATRRPYRSGRKAKVWSGCRELLLLVRWGSSARPCRHVHSGIGASMCRCAAQTARSRKPLGAVRSRVEIRSTPSLTAPATAASSPRTAIRRRPPEPARTRSTRAASATATERSTRSSFRTGRHGRSSIVTPPVEPSWAQPAMRSLTTTPRRSSAHRRRLPARSTSPPSWGLCSGRRPRSTRRAVRQRVSTTATP